MKQKLIVVFAVIMLQIFVGCGGSSSGSSNSGNVGPSDNFNAEGYPIVDEKITLKVVMYTAPFVGDIQTSDYFEELEKLTNIHVEFEQITSKPEEFFNLMIAAEDYRDIAIYRFSDTMMLPLMEGDAITTIDEYLQYAPNLASALDAYPEGKKTSVMSDGKLWGFPIIREEPSNVGIRDQWMINQQWLTELNLPMPKTVDDFYNTLKAFKDNAGTGTIPEEVIPWYLWWDRYANGGQFELLNAFGVFTPGNFSGLSADGFMGNLYVSVGEDGKVDYTANDEAIKEPLKFMHKLYSEGLIPPDAFTGAGTYEAMVTSDTLVVGSFLKYFNTDPTHEKWAPMPPLTSENNPDGIYRRQTNGFTRNMALVFNNNENIEASIRWLDTIASPDWSLQANYGMFGGGYMEKDGENIIQLPATGNEAYAEVPSNHVPLIILPETVENMTYAGGQADRDKTIKEIYTDHTYPAERYFPNLVWTNEEIDDRKVYESDINTYVSSTFARWITEGGIDEQWDSYVSELESLGINELLDIYQVALDRHNAN